jgi:HEAT repeat protein
MGFWCRNVAIAIVTGLLAVAFFFLFLGAPSHEKKREANSSLQGPDASTESPRSEGTSSEPTKNGLSTPPDFNVELAKLSDPNLSIKSRIGVALEIGEKGGVELWRTALTMMLPMNIREALLESIGNSGRSEASEFLRGYLGDPDQGMRRASIRGLAATGREEDAQIIGSLMEKQGLAIEESTEVALALGGSRAPNATTILLQAYSKADGSELVQCLILGLAQRPFGQTQGFFQQMLGDVVVESDRKKELLSALGQFDSVKEDFFAPYLQSPNPEVRSGAYLGLGVLTEGNPGPRLLMALQSEADPQARLSLYEALGMKSSGDPWAMNRIALGEKEPIPRILAAKALARSLQGRETTDAAVVEFGRVWAPEMARLAIEGSNTEGLQAVSALRIRKSPEVREALRQISTRSQDTKVQAAAQKALLGMEK